MPGVTKHIFDSYIADVQEHWNNQLKKILPTLPKGYSHTDIFQAIKRFYPYEWAGVENAYEYYQIKDKYLQSLVGRRRFNMLPPEKLLKKNAVYRRMMSEGFAEQYNQSFDEEVRAAKIEALSQERDPKIARIKEKIELAKSHTQQVTPPFIDKLIGLYSRKNTTQKNRMYILKELKKYYNKRVILFFYKLNDTEINKQLRFEAFYHLQSFNFQPRLRAQKYMQAHTSNKKRKAYFKKDYANQTCHINETPDELEYLLAFAKYQDLKEYDFFISHSSKDAELVRALINALNKEGKYVYCDWINDSDYLKRNLVCQATLKVIEKQLEKSKCLLFVSSENSTHSVWCKYELNFFRKLGRPMFVIPAEKVREKPLAIIPFEDDWYLDADYEQSALYEGQKIKDI